MNGAMQKIFLMNFPSGCLSDYLVLTIYNIINFVLIVDKTTSYINIFIKLFEIKRHRVLNNLACGGIRLLRNNYGVQEF